MLLMVIAVANGDIVRVLMNRVKGPGHSKIKRHQMLLPLLANHDFVCINPVYRQIRDIC
jgi:hypothetical protein